MRHIFYFIVGTFLLAISTSLSAQIFVDSTGSNGFGDLPHLRAKSRFSNFEHEYNLFLRSAGVDSVRGVGLYNFLEGGVAAKYGMWNHVEQAEGATGETFGLRNVILHGGDADAYGVYNDLSANNGSRGRLFGNYSLIDDRGTYAPGKLYANFYGETFHRRKNNAYGSYLLVRSKATGADKASYGQYIDVRGKGDAQRYGLYSNINGGPGYAGYFVGDVHVNGTFTQASDERLKKNVGRVDGALDLVRALRPRTYNYKDSEAMGFGDGDRVHYGFLAREVAKVLPDLVSDVHHTYPTGEVGIDQAETADELGFPTLATGSAKSGGEDAVGAADIKGVRYLDMIALLVGAVQEQGELIEERDKAIDQLAEQLAELTTRLEAISRRLEATENCVPCATLMDTGLAAGLELYPNPASKEFIVVWTVETVEGVRVEIYDSTGRNMKKVDVLVGQRYRVETVTWPRGTYHVKLIDRNTARLIGTQSVIISQ